jgi:hypothetical protein
MVDDVNSNAADLSAEMGKFIEILEELESKFPDNINVSILRKAIMGLINGVNEFRGKTDNAATSFINISEIETIILKTQDKLDSNVLELFHDEFTKLDESSLIAKKKRELADLDVKVAIFKRYKRSIMSLAGELTFNRLSLKATSSVGSEKIKSLTGSRYVFPLDEAIGIDRLPYKLTVKAMLEIAHWVQATHSYVAAKDAIHRNTKMVVNDETIRTVANTIGHIVFKNDVASAVEAHELYDKMKIKFSKNKIDHILYLETDGAMLHIREKPEDDGSVWKENKLGLAFSTDNIRWYKNKSGEREHRVIKREYRAFIGKSDEFQHHMLALALRNGYGKYRQTVILGDGATWIRSMKEMYFPDAQQILDYYHLCEHISKFAKIVFKPDSSQLVLWTNKVCELFKNSKTKKGIKEIEMLTARGKTLSEQISLLGYIDNNINNIDYDTYKKNGWFIGSGAIESGNKSVLQQRLKQPGMRWNTDNGQFIVTLMSKSKSFLWETDVVTPILSHYGFF